MNILVVFGTRPEAIKLAPVIRELEKHNNQLKYRVCVTSQHREMLDQVLSQFSIKADYDLAVMTENQTPAEVASAVLARLEPVFRKERPDWVVLQGDTTTAATASMAAFYNKIPVAYVEAGLRTGNKWLPYPEEINRRIISLIADLYFAPTESARENLIQEGVPGKRIFVTGNTVIDALLWVARCSPAPETLAWLEGIGLALDEESHSIMDRRKLILVTTHRRESFGDGVRSICLALRQLATCHEGLVIIYPVHRNPKVWGPVNELLGKVSNIILVPPLDYRTMVFLMKRSFLILTDSGGIQEEAPSLGVPVLILRDVTERPEGVEAGVARIVGVNCDHIVSTVRRFLDSPELRQRMSKATNPYGDGKAAKRIVDKILSFKGKYLLDLN